MMTLPLPVSSAPGVSSIAWLSFAHYNNTLDLPASLPGSMMVP